MMNSLELSVRSMAVDFLVSLLGYIYQELGSIESISLCMLSVLPEVAAREIALFSPLIKSLEDAECSLWPLRRAFADVEETNPIDDDRVDQELLPSLTTLCRSGQAIIDGVMVELRLRCPANIAHTNFDLEEIRKTQLSSNRQSSFQNLQRMPPETVFDADEESVLEAVTFFSSETSLKQKLRWINTLRDLHVAKKQFCEVACTLFLCAQSLIESLDHLPNLWQPSQFGLWNDESRSPWLSSVGLSGSQSNVAVMEFANAFLGLDVFTHQQKKFTQHYLSTEDVCLALISVINQMEVAYKEEGGMEDLACAHLEELLSMITATINNGSKMHHSEALRRVRASICSKLASFSEQGIGHKDKRGLVYVRVVLYGNKPARFKESTAIPTFFEWGIPSICRVSNSALTAAASMREQKGSWEECIRQCFAKPLVEALKSDDACRSIILRTNGFKDSAADDVNTYISIAVVQRKSPIKSRKFFERHDDGCITEYTVAHKFPHSLSRQRSLITSEIKVTTHRMNGNI